MDFQENKPSNGPTETEWNEGENSSEEGTKKKNKNEPKIVRFKLGYGYD